MLRVAFFLLFAFTAVASAQPQPTLDVELPASDHGAALRSAQGRGLSVAPGGGFAILSGREVLVADRQGRIRTRIPLAPDNRKLMFVCVVAAAEDDIAVLYQYAEGGPKRGLVLFRHAADGRLKRESFIPPLAREAHQGSIYEVEQCAPTRDAALLLTGGYGPGPYAWWLAKFTLEAGRVFQAGPGKGIPERVAAMTSRVTGHWHALVQEMKTERDAELEWYLHHYTDGKLTKRTRVDIPGGYAAAILRRGSVIAVNADKLFFLDDDGKVTREAAWPFHSTGSIASAYHGFWAVVRDGQDKPDILVRVNDAGWIRWRSEGLEVLSIARISDNEIAAVVLRTGETNPRLMRFDDRPGIEALP